MRAPLLGEPSTRIASIGIVLGSLSVVACLVVISFNSYFPVLRQPPGRFVRTRSVLTLLQMLVYVSYAGFSLRAPQSYAHNPSCMQSDQAFHAHVVQAFFVTTDSLEIGIVFFQLAQALQILYIVRDPFKPLRHAGKLVFAGFIVTLAEPLAVVSALYRHPSDGASLPPAWYPCWAANTHG